MEYMQNLLFFEKLIELHRYAEVHNQSFKVRKHKKFPVKISWNHQINSLLLSNEHVFQKYVAFTKLLQKSVRVSFNNFQTTHTQCGNYGKFSLTKKIFCQINQKCVRENSRNFHTMHTVSTHTHGILLTP